VGRRRFEMFQYRQVLVRLRQGDSDRDVARARLMGRPKVAALRALHPGVAMSVPCFTISRCDRAWPSWHRSGRCRPKEDRATVIQVPLRR